MSSKTLGNLIRISTIFAGLCGLLLCAFILPTLGQGMVEVNPELSGWFWPWLSFAWLFALPCFAILVYIWKVSTAVIGESVFTIKTAGWVKAGAMLTLGDAVLLFVGNIVLLVFGMSHPSMLICCTIGAIFAVALALLAAVLSRYLTKAATLQEESEGTL